MKPLTIEELKALPIGDWVWIVVLKSDCINKAHNGKYYHIQHCGSFGDKELWCGWQGYGTAFEYSDYGTKWIAYKNKEQAEISHERHETGKMAKIVGLCDYNDMTCEQCRLKNNMHVCMHRLAMQKLLDAGYVNIEDRKQKGEIVELPYKTEKLQLGDTVYYLQNYFNDATLQHERKVKRTVIDYIAKDYIEVNNGVWLSVENFWLIPEEAERRLAELKGE